MNLEKYVKQSDMMNAIPDTIFYGDGLRKRFEELKTYTMPMSAILYLQLINEIKVSPQSTLLLKKIREYELRNPASAVCLVEEWLHNRTCPNYLGVACIDGTCPKANADEYAERGYTVVHSCDECHYVEGCTDCYWADREDLRTQDKHLAAMFTSIAAQLGVCVFDENGKLREQPVIIKEMYNAFTSMIKNSAEVVKEIMDVFADEEGAKK